MSHIDPDIQTDSGQVPFHKCGRLIIDSMRIESDMSVNIYI